MKSMRISASLACREAVRILGLFRQGHIFQTKPLSAKFNLDSPCAGLFYSNVALGKRTLHGSLERLSEDYIAPAMADLNSRTSSEPLGHEYMEIPFGVTDAANERWDGIAMRCLINDVQPVRDSKSVWSRAAKYYDVSTDDWVLGQCGIILHFAVHKSGMQSGLRIPVITGNESVESRIS